MPRACPVCGSRKWRKDAISSSAVCEEGHILQGFRTETVVAEATPYALQKRTLRKGPRVNKRKVEGQRNKDFYHGSRAEFLKLQGLQLLLRLQIQALAQIWQLPDALEMIARDLWTYQLLNASVPEPIEEEQAELAPQLQQMNLGEEEEEERSSTDSSSDSDSVDSDFLAKLSDTGSRLGSPVVAPPPRKKRKRRLAASDTLVTMLLALWVLRIPVIHVEFETLVNSNKIPYIDFARSTLYPASMYKHTNRDVMQALAPRRCPRPLLLFRRVSKLARVVSRQNGVIVPEVNFGPVAWHVVSSLGGSPTTYTQVTRLLELIDANVALDTDFVTRQDSEGTRTRRYRDVHMPEMVVAAAWVVVMKLAYGLDGKDRVIVGSNESATGLPARDKWVQALKDRLRSGHFNHDHFLRPHHNFAGMQTDDMDRFLDAAEGVLLKDRLDVETTFPLISAQSPPPRRPLVDTWAPFHAVDGSQLPTPVELDIMDNPSLPDLPGDKLASFDATDTLGQLPRDYEVVLDASARVVGVSMVEMADLVELFERRMEKERVARGRFEGSEFE